MALSKEEFEKLAKMEAENNVSIYIPTHESGMEVNEGKDQIAFKNEVQKVEIFLEKKYGQEKSWREKIIKPLYDLVNNASFWKTQKQGLALFINESFMSYYKLPVSFSSFSVVSTKFMLAPLLQALTTDRELYILALGNKQVRFYETNLFNIKEIEVGELVPLELEEAVDAYDPSKQERNKRIGYDGPLSTQHITQSQGNGYEGREGYLFEYFRDVSEEIKNRVKSKNIPLLLIGTEDLTKIYKDANTYENLLNEGININPERLEQDQLHNKGNEILEKNNQKVLQKQVERFKELAGTGRTSNVLNNILFDAFAGRIDTLFLVKNKHVWGNYDVKGTSVQISPEPDGTNYCLYNLAVTKTIENEGNVFVLDQAQMPQHESLSDIVVIYRY